MADILEIHDAYDRAQSTRSERLRELGTGLLPRLVDLSWVNNELDHTGHPELHIEESVTMTSIDDVPNPADKNRYGHFAFNFYMAGSYVPTRQPSDRNDWKRVPLGIPELEDLLTRRVRIDSSLARFPDHRARLAFYRAGALAPGLIINLAADISAGQPFASRDLEVFYAYRIMRMLVDRRDPGVIVSGKPYTAYLFKKRVSVPAKPKT